jgi:predicted lipoprotein with Yx(FWY)xxD motif
MQPQSPATRRTRPLIQAAFLLAAMATVIVLGNAGGASASGQATMSVVKEAQNETLGRTVLTNKKGHTLYSLSVEKNGKFTCTGECLSVWHPLVVPAGVKPTGPVKLGIVKRPDGRLQVTYRGRPLYRFGGDAKAGDVNGEGVKDVGTWHAASPPATDQPQPTPSPTPMPPYGY